MTVPTSSIATAAPELVQGRWAFLRSQRATSIGLLLPALIFLAVMTQAPFLLTLWYSVHS